MLDIFLLIVLLWAIYDGWHDGFVKQLASAVGFLLGLFVAATFYSTLGEYLTVDGSQTNMMTSVVAFFILWIIVPIALGFCGKGRDKGTQRYVPRASPTVFSVWASA